MKYNNLFIKAVNFYKELYKHDLNNNSDVKNNIYKCVIFYKSLEPIAKVQCHICN